MKNSYILTGIIAVSLLTILACSEEDPKLPTPVVDFETDPEIVEVGLPVEFKNLTINASSYEWDFGDGQTSSEISPEITYDESGTFTVSLKAFTDDNQSDSLSMDISVGERVLTGLGINSIPFVNREGQDWDEITNQEDSTRYPDFILTLGPEDDLSIGIATPLLRDLSPQDLPIGYSINPGGDPIILTNESWEASFFDFEGEEIETAQNEDFEIMEVITFNPVIIPTSNVEEDGSGFVQISLGAFSIDLLFQIE